MSSPNAEPAKVPPGPLPSNRSGIKAVLRYTGIPPSWLDKRPSLPSRNWLIFLSVTSSVAGLYLYDRRECKRIRQEYIDRVKHLSEIPIDPFESPRKVTVYGAKWPGDDDYDQSLKYFRKYVKPILVAAAVDYTMVPGKRHGDIERRVAEEIRIRRREDSGLDLEPDIVKALPTYKPLAERRRRELEGGIVIVGRPTFKEFMVGLKRGWTEGLDKVDRDEQLAHSLEEDSYFDELPDEPVGLVGVEGDSPSTSSELSRKPPSAFPSAQNSPVFSPLQLRSSTTPTPPSHTGPQTPSAPHPAPSGVPPLPPILFVPFLDYIGFKQIPLMIWDFFNQRHKVQAGAKAGYNLVMGVSRPLDVPDSLDASSEFTDREENREDPRSPAPRGDLDFDQDKEAYFNSSAHNLPADTDKARQNYYDSLVKKLATARELARSIREPTQEELNNPPPTEVELRAERMKKERRWRDDLEGWNIVKPSSEVVWDKRFGGALRVISDPLEDIEAIDKSSS